MVNYTAARISIEILVVLFRTGFLLSGHSNALGFLGKVLPGFKCRLESQNGSKSELQCTCRLESKNKRFNLLIPPVFIYQS